MPISEHVVRYVRRIASVVTRDVRPDVAEIAVDASTNTLQFHSGGQKEVVDLSNTQTITGDKTLTGTTVLRTPVETLTDATRTVLTTESGKVFICTADTGTQVFTLPSAATAGLQYTFICGHVDGEIHVGVTGAQQIKGKTHAANNAVALVTTASTGLLKNTAASNVVGDKVTLISDGTATWFMRGTLGIWSAT